MIETSRRGLITGLVSFIAAPAIVRASSLMPVKVMPDLAEYWLKPEHGMPVRRAFLDKPIVQIYQASPLVRELLRKRDEWQTIWRF